MSWSVWLRLTLVFMGCCAIKLHNVFRLEPSRTSTFSFLINLRPHWAPNCRLIWAGEVDAFVLSAPMLSSGQRSVADSWQTLGNQLTIRTFDPAKQKLIKQAHDPLFGNGMLDYRLNPEQLSLPRAKRQSKKTSQSAGLFTLAASLLR